jgi:hypothetical protein
MATGSDAFALGSLLPVLPASHSGTLYRQTKILSLFSMWQSCRAEVKGNLLVLDGTDVVSLGGARVDRAGADDDKALIEVATDTSRTVLAAEASTADEWVRALAACSWASPAMEEFHIKASLGSGAYGVVSLAKFRGHLVALKSIPKEVKRTERRRTESIVQYTVRMANKQAQVVASVQNERVNLQVLGHHPYICALLYAFQTESHWHLAMEYMQRGDVFDLRNEIVSVCSCGARAPAHSRAVRIGTPPRGHV